MRVSLLFLEFLNTIENCDICKRLLGRPYTGLNTLADDEYSKIMRKPQPRRYATRKFTTAYCYGHTLHFNTLAWYSRRQ